PRAVGLDELGLTDRLAGRERRARDRAGELVDGVRALVLADEGRAGRGGGPGLPAEVRRRDLAAEACIRGGDEPVGGLELRDRRRGGRRRVRPTGQQRGDAAGDDGDDEHNDTRGCHTLTSYKSRCGWAPGRNSAGLCATATRRPDRYVVVHARFQQ